MGEIKTFDLRINDRQSSSLADHIIDVLSNPVEGDKESCVVKHIADQRYSIFNIRGVSVVINYSNKPDIRFYMGNTLEDGVKPAVEYIEEKFSSMPHFGFPGAKLVEVDKL